MKNTLVDLYEKICEDVDLLRNPELKGDELQEAIDRSLAVNKTRELQMSFIAMMIKTADNLSSLDTSFRLDASLLPFFTANDREQDGKPKLTHGRKPLIDTSRRERDTE